MIPYAVMPYKTVIRLLGVARNPANGFPARLLCGVTEVSSNSIRNEVFFRSPTQERDDHGDRKANAAADIGRHRKGNAGTVGSSPQDDAGPGAAGQPFWAGPMAAATSQWLPTWRCPTKRWGSGAPGSWNGDWTACRTSPAAADRERLLMKTWNG